MGRFLTTDPLTPPIDDPHVSAYLYVNNRLGVLVDPSGMIPEWLTNSGRAAGGAGESLAGVARAIHDPIAALRGQVQQATHAYRQAGGSGHGWADGLNIGLNPMYPAAEGVHGAIDARRTGDWNRFGYCITNASIATAATAAGARSLFLGLRGTAANTARALPAGHRPTPEVGPAANPGPFRPSAPPNFTDPVQAPGAGWQWRGNGPPGSRQGSWHNPTTGESLHPDLNHRGPIGPHYDYRAPNGVDYRVYLDGRMVPK